jgi:hypothetical protein
MMPSSCPESSGEALVKALYGAIGLAVLIALKYFYPSAKKFYNKHCQSQSNASSRAPIEGVAGDEDGVAAGSN